MMELSGRGRNAEDLKALFNGLQTSPTLEDLSLKSIKVDGDLVDSPTASMVYCVDLGGEEYYVWVYKDEYVQLEGFEEVQGGLGEMAKCMIFR